LTSANIVVTGGSASTASAGAAAAVDGFIGLFSSTSATAS